MKLSVIVPAFNEALTIAEILTKLLAQKEINQVVVVNDGSTDNTKEIITKLSQKHQKLTIINHPSNLGKGAAIKTGLNQISGDYVLIQDADLEYDPAEITKLIEPIKNNRTEVVYGSRFFGPHTNMFFWHLVGNKFLNFLVNILYNSILSDMETCYKLLPTNLFKELNIKEKDFGIEPEITCKLLKRQVKIMEVPISYVGRTYQEGKKISWKDGLIAVKVIIRIRIRGN
jgi:glycosyltransferase involved in cell wall biosynthesis